MELVFKQQPKKQATERWEELNDKTSILIASLDNDEYRIGMERERRRLAQRDAKFGVDQIGIVPGEDTEHGIQCKLMGKFVVRDWRGVPDENGSDVKYSEENAATLLRTNIQFFLWVLQKAGDIAAEALAEREETVGKSSSASNGKKKPAGSSKEAPSQKETPEQTP